MQPARRVFSCRGCLTRLSPHQRRTFSRSAPRHAAPAGPSPAGIAHLSSRRLISVSGPDAAKYLQGVITANLFSGSTPRDQHLRTDAGFYAAFLTGQGRVLHDVFVYHDVRDTPSPHPAGHSWLLEVDASQAEALQKQIRRYKLRAKFDVRLLDQDEGRVWQAWDDNNASHTIIPSKNHPTIITTPDTRAPNLGTRLLTFNSSPPSDSTSGSGSDSGNDLPQLPESAYRLRRYLHGIPEGQSEILAGTALPHESNTDLMGGIDFRKGCYVGQELTIRTEHRGVVRKRILPCVLYPDDADAAAPDTLGYRPEIGSGAGVTADMVPAGASIGRVGKKGRSAGKWLSGVGNVGLALCRLEIMTDVVLPGETGGVGFDAGDEFVVGLEGREGEEGEGEGEGGKVRIKAFVPEWLRTGLANRERH
ncbi:hypothetical protein C8A00DRAFT_12990 [Chaetomidium leptoderma]|uniref:Iron-sulfur cluster assembly factor IBA57 homolog, mitochondrial n=1 Tax=Chaetomidium leptoderma TaxID=669021 RepID=A0AAN7A0S5_9PEZI|nr:hypothetical protein C8A00DRAFT_12990 [Chaetomidium leptoderma]